VMTDFFVGLLSFLFTLMILSYLVGDNPLFRLSIHVFVGVTAGYIGLIVWKQVILNKLFAPMFAGDLLLTILLIIPLIMALFLITKIFPKYQAFGNWVVAFLVGVGAAAAIAGALTGTLLPQTWASINLFDLGGVSSTPIAERFTEGLFILLGTVTTLAYFQFSVRQNSARTGQRGLFMRIIAYTGEIFLAITFGALFAGVLSSALAAMVNRIQSLVEFLTSLFF
jgi:hypothetical protein